jgi:hypothetical protein
MALNAQVAGVFSASIGLLYKSQLFLLDLSFMIPDLWFEINQARFEGASMRYGRPPREEATPAFGILC